jgi:hypothetical protein
LDRFPRLDNHSTNGLDFNLLNSGDVSARPTEKPLVSGLPAELTILEVSCATEELRLIGSNDGQRGHLRLQLLSREEREGLASIVVIESVLLVGVTELAVAVGIVNRVAGLVPLHGVANHAEVARRDHNHRFDIRDNLLMFLEGVHLGADDDSGASLVVVQHVNILEGEDAKH